MAAYGENLMATHRGERFSKAGDYAASLIPAARRPSARSSKPSCLISFPRLTVKHT